MRHPGIGLFKEFRRTLLILITVMDIITSSITILTIVTFLSEAQPVEAAGRHLDTEPATDPCGSPGRGLRPEGVNAG